MARNFMVLDVEGTDTKAVYDLGFIVVDGNSNEIIARESLINADVFCDRMEMVASYYGEAKRDLYIMRLATGDARLVDTLTMARVLADAITAYGVRDVWAYNCTYDAKALASTFDRYNAVNPLEFVRVRDVWSYAGSTICDTFKFAKWAIENERVTAAGNPRTSAETVYAYLTGNTTFEEEHTGLQDALIEFEILKAAKRRKQRATLTSGSGWRCAAARVKML